MCLCLCVQLCECVCVCVYLCVCVYMSACEWLVFLSIVNIRLKVVGHGNSNGC